jgi:hypothetical protein
VGTFEIAGPVARLLTIRRARAVRRIAAATLAGVLASCAGAEVAHAQRPAQRPTRGRGAEPAAQTPQPTAEERQQRREVCLEQTRALLAVFDTDEGCSLPSEKMREMGRELRRIKMEVCGEWRSPTDQDSDQWPLQLTRSRRCKGRTTSDMTAKLDAFVAKAKAAGIQESGISKAILEGRFVPPFDELRAAGSALGWDYKETNDRWNARFGSIDALGEVATYQEGSWVTRTGKDLRYQMYMNTSRSMYLKEHYGLDEGAHDTYERAVAHLRSRGATPGEIAGNMDRYIASEPASVWGYFIEVNTGTGKYVHRDDYEALAKAAASGTAGAGRASTLAAPRCEPIPEPFASTAVGRILYILDSTCPYPLTPPEQLMVAGLSGGLWDACSFPRSPAARAALLTFKTSNTWIAGFGRDFSNPSAAKVFESQGVSGLTYKAGLETAKTLGCGPEANRVAEQIVAYVERTSAPDGKTNRFVRECVRIQKGAYTEAQCQCLADVGRAEIPDIHQRTFSLQTFPGIMKKNPILGGQIIVQCGIVKY